MARFRNIPGSGYGNVYIDSLIWGGKVWDQSQEPILVALGDVPADGTYDTDYDEAVQVHGILEDTLYLETRQLRGHWWDEFIPVIVEALNVYSSVANITFAPAQTISEANMVWWMYPIGDGKLGWHESPDANNPSHQRWGIFNSFHSGMLAEREFGGMFLGTVIHEIGHGLGLAHPHDGGDREDASKFPGVEEAGDKGDFGLNQTVFATMSYNDGYDKTPKTYEYGNQGGLGALDIAAIQLIYGANMSTATGNDTYTLPTKNARGTGWMSIWDAGGTDTMTAAGSTAGVTIDLRAATLRPGDPGAGGYISQQNGIAGGFTIANGVVIENATGSAFDDVLIGNAATNTLNGGAGNDIYYVDSPNDVVIDASGVDTVYATFAFSNPAIENVFVNGVQVSAGGKPLENGFRLVRGSGAKDVLVGESKSDRIYGGLGKDVLTGGGGQDIFVFDTKPGKANVDKITDYVVADDNIWLDNKVMKKLGKGSEAKPQLLNKKCFVFDKAKDANDYLVYVKKTGALYYDEDGSGSKAAIQLASLSPKLKMSAFEFFVI